jgi:Werner syndrome ATP-dependent helicase
VFFGTELFVDMTVLPSLLPSRREAGQTKHALDMLSQCFRYAISADRCRVQILLDYFGEDLESGICDMCDTCVKGPSPSEDLTNEALLLLTALAAPQVTSHTGSTNCSIVCMCL